MKSKLKGNLLLLLTTLAWGSSFVSQRLGMSSQGLSPSAFIAMRTLMGVAVLIPFIAIRDKGKEASDKKQGKNLLIGGIVTGIILCFASIMQTWGMAYPDTSAGKAGFITSLYIIFVPIAGIFRGRKISPAVGIGIVIAMLGMYLLCIYGSGSGFLSRGDFYVFISAVLYTLHILSIDYYTERVEDAVRLACIQFFVCGALALLWSLCRGTFSPAEVWKNILPLLYSGVISCGIGYTLQTVGQKYTDPTSASLIMSLESVFSVISGAVFLNELMTYKQIFGCVLVFLAVIISQIPFDRIIRNIKKRNALMKRTGYFI